MFKNRRKPVNVIYAVFQPKSPDSKKDNFWIKSSQTFQNEVHTYTQFGGFPCKEITSFALIVRAGGQDQPKAMKAKE